MYETMPQVTEMVKKFTNFFSQFVLDTNGHQPLSPSHMNEKVKGKSKLVGRKILLGFHPQV